MLSLRFCGSFLIAILALVACGAGNTSTPPPGPTLVLEVEGSVLRDEVLESTSSRMADVLRTNSIRYTGRGVHGDAARIQLADQSDMQHALEALREIARAPNGDTVLALSETNDGFVEARLADAHYERLLRQAATQSAEVIKRRLYPNGGSMPDAGIQSGGRFIVHAPPNANLNLVDRIVAIPGRLTFHLVSEDAHYLETGRLPPGYVLVQPHPSFGDRTEVVRERPSLISDHLTRVTPSTDQYTHEWVLSFQLDAEGARTFCALTREHTGERFAILFDMQVITAPTINEAICGGSGQISGNFTADSARDLAMLLNAGGLPAPVRLVEIRAPE